MATDKKISELNPAAAFVGVEKFEIVQGGLNLAGTPEQMKDYIGGITREFNRTWSAELLFDKNEIAYANHDLTGDLNYTVALTGHLSNQFSSATQIVNTDGTRVVTFTGFTFVLGDIQSGSIPDAGTYLVLFLYWNGVAIVNWTIPSLEVAGLVPLSAPGSFAGVPGAGDPETEIDLTWATVSNNSGYEIDYSTTGGGGPWITLTSPASGATSYTHTGLTANTTYHYRIRALGDDISFSNSVYSIVAATTEDTGDVTPPTFTFSPVDTATDVGVNDAITIVASEPLLDADGVTEITNANAANYIVLKETNSAGANIAFTATIDATKTTFTITPTTGYGGNQLVFVEISGVEDLNGNEAVADSITFTTSAYTTFNGTSNLLKFGDLLDGVWALANTKFKLKITVRNLPLSGDRFMFAKYSTTDNQRSFVWWTSGSSVLFTWARVGSSASRVIKWDSVMDAAEHDLELQYDGSINTNDGLDRATLLIDGVTAGSKSLFSTSGVLSAIFNATSQLSFSAGVSGTGVVTSANYFSGDAKNLQVLSGVADTNELEVPVLGEGTDISGNARNGTWV